MSLTLTELLTKLLQDKKVTNIEMTKRPSRTCITATFEYMKRDEDEDELSDVPVPLPWDATDEQLDYLKSRYGDTRALQLLSVIGNDALLLINEPGPVPEMHLRLTRWFGKALDMADREILAQDGAKAVSWKTKSPWDLFQKMAKHYEVLKVAIQQDKSWFATIEAVDIVNYALMISTRCMSVIDGSEYK